MGGSHIPVLNKLLDENIKAVLEFGAGWYSTPLLFWRCLDKNIEFNSYETNKDWVKTLDGLATYVDSYDKVEEKEYGIVLIDHAPAERRIVDIKRFRDLADYIVIHDAEPENDKLYKYSKIYNLFKYRYTYKKHKPFTTVLSNKKEFIL